MFKILSIIVGLMLIPTWVNANTCALNFNNSINFDSNQRTCDLYMEITKILTDEQNDFLKENKINVQKYPTLNLYQPGFSNVKGFHVFETSTIHVPYHYQFDLEDIFFKVPVTPDVVDSFVTHELAHAVVFKLMADTASELTLAWHEFAAYCVQFHLMPEYLREEIVNNYKNEFAFKSEYHVTDLHYIMAPNEFAVKSWLTCQERGVETMIQKIINNDVAVMRAWGN